MLLSVITPVLNREKYIGEAIESIVRLNNPEIEHIIIDGGSTDGTLGILSSYSHLKWISEPDTGVYDAMNKGISMAEGEWIYILGSDDRIHDSNVIQDLLPHFNDPEISMLYGNVLTVPSLKIYDGIFSAGKIAVKNICQQAVFYRRSLFSRVGLFQTECRQLGDWAFHIKVFGTETKTIRFVDRIIADYNEEGVSSRIFDLPFWSSREKVNIACLLPDTTRKQVYKGIAPYFYYILEQGMVLKKIGFLMRFLFYVWDIQYLKDMFHLLRIRK